MLAGRKLTRRKSSMINDRIFARQAVICKAFAHPKRLKLLSLLSEGERRMSDLQRELALSRQYVTACRDLASCRCNRHLSQRSAHVLFSGFSRGEEGLPPDPRSPAQPDSRGKEVRHL